MLKINYFAKTNYRGKGEVFGIKREDRRLHIYILGRTGMGKTTLLLNMILNDIYGGEGVGFIDPHGDAAERLLEMIPKKRAKDLIYFDPTKKSSPSLNVFKGVRRKRRDLVASNLISSFKRLWRGFWGPRLEYLLRNSILTLLEDPKDHTLGEVSKLFTSEGFRRDILARLRDRKLKDFWSHDFPKFFLKGSAAESIAAILNKIGALNLNPILDRTINRKDKNLEFRKLMDERKIFIANLSKGRIGEDASMLLGSLILSSFYLASLSREDIPEEERELFFLFVDEFQEFLPENFSSILSESRKYGLCLTLAHQYLGQLEESLREAIFGNVGTIIVFAVGPEDAKFLEREFRPEFKMRDLVEQGKYHIYLKMAINGKTSGPFSAFTLPPFAVFKKGKVR
jgi:type IV secretory pathway TraG/TraD family ATPase VirD4